MRKALAAKYLTLSYSALRLWRILAGMCLLYDWTLRMMSARWSMLEHGVLWPSDVIGQGLHRFFCLYAYLPDWGTWFMLGLSGITYLAFMLGVGGFWIRFLTCFFFIQANERNLAVIDGMHSIMGAILLGAVALPLQSKEKGEFRTVGALWVFFLMGTIYFFNFYAKAGLIWKLGLGPYYATYFTLHQTAIGIWLRTHLPMGVWLLLGYLIWYAEGAILFLIFSPIRTKETRVIATAIVMLLHAGFALCISLGAFAPTCMAASVLLLPETFFVKAREMATSCFSSRSSYRQQ